MAGIPSFTAFSIVALATELNTDPAGLGYAPLLTTGNDNGLSEALNLVREGGAYQVRRDPVQPSDIFASIVPAEFDLLTATSLSRLQVVLSIPSLDLAVSAVQEMVTGVFTLGSQSRANIVALTLRQGSRAEALWGPGAVVTPNEVNDART